MMARRSVFLVTAGTVLLIGALSTHAGADTWFQTDWSGGPGQLSWSDSTMYYTEANVNGWRNPGDLKLNTPDDASWVNTGDLAGADQARGLIEASDGSFYVATGPNGDVFRSTDAGTTWTNTGELVGPTYATSLIQASDGAFYAGTGPTNGVVFKSIDAGTTWVNTGNLPGMNWVWSVLEASDGAIYAAAANGVGDDGRVFKSVDGGTTWDSTGTLAGAGRALWLIEASDGAIYVATASAGDVFKTVDAGTTWANTGNLAGIGWVYTLLEASDGAIYAGTGPSNGDVFKTVDAGTTWANTGDLAGAQWVSSLVETSDGAIYAGTYGSGDVYKSVDAGTSWANTGNLAGATDVYSLMQASDGILWAGTWFNGDVFKAGYFPSGNLVSSVYESDNMSVTYGIMSWTETAAAGTLLIKVRTDTLADMSTAVDWDSCPAVVNGEDISGLSSINDHNNYIQYQFECSTYSPDLSPILHDVTIEYTVDVQGPIADSAVASDGTNPVPGIDDDDYVLIYFGEPATDPYIDALNIDGVLALSGGHSWLDGFGGLDTTYWNPAGDRLIIRLSVEVSPPTVAVGDTITPDRVTIVDQWGNPCTTQVVITGTFTAPGAEERTSSRTLKVWSLSQNKPNPFNRGTVISYSLPSEERVRLDVFDLSGRLVATLVNESRKAGTHRVSWNADEEAAGIYFYRLRAGNFESTRKMVLID